MKSIKCLKHVPLFRKCVFVYENGQILIKFDNKDNYNPIDLNEEMKLSDEDRPNNICLISDNHVLICCNNSTLYSIKFSHFKEAPTMTKAQIPDLPADTVVYDVIKTSKY